MKTLSEEHLAYHTLANIMHADYRKLAELYERHASWQASLASIVQKKPEGETVPPLGPDMRLLLRADGDFPAVLREIPYPPHGIYVRGPLPQGTTRTVAIVGTRKATPEGKDVARRFARELAEAGCAIISGLAFGLDAAAHEGALDGKGYTAAVLATGLDRVYPQWNAKLAERILANGGALISEYPPGSPALPYRFLERNRIVSGLAEGVLVIEAPERSGSLATARFALEQNRQVFVVPGPATHPNFAGSHALIRAGAELVTEPAHITEALGIIARPDHAETGTYSDEERLIRDAFRTAKGPLAIDTIIEYTKLNAQTVNRTLSLLIIQGTVAENGNGYTLNRP
ncbi:MAG: hypothetical protein RL681_135 [Candidatus Parcubacteria bacterium]|jgi:DNA processing protein